MGKAQRDKALLEIGARQLQGTTLETDLTDHVLIQIVRSLNGELNSPLSHRITQNMEAFEAKTNAILQQLGLTHLTFQANKVISDTMLESMLSMVFQGTELISQKINELINH